MLRVPEFSKSVSPLTSSYVIVKSELILLPDVRVHEMLNVASAPLTKVVLNVSEHVASGILIAVTTMSFPNAFCRIKSTPVVVALKLVQPIPAAGTHFQAGIYLGLEHQNMPMQQ